MDSGPVKLFNFFVVVHVLKIMFVCMLPNIGSFVCRGVDEPVKSFCNFFPLSKDFDNYLENVGAQFFQREKECQCRFFFQYFPPGDV